MHGPVCQLQVSTPLRLLMSLKTVLRLVQVSSFVELQRAAPQQPAGTYIAWPLSAPLKLERPADHLAPSPVATAAAAAGRGDVAFAPLELPIRDGEGRSVPEMVSAARVRGTEITLAGGIVQVAEGVMLQVQGTVTFQNVIFSGASVAGVAIASARLPCKASAHLQHVRSTASGGHSEARSSCTQNIRQCSACDCVA